MQHWGGPVHNSVTKLCLAKKQTKKDPVKKIDDAIRTIKGNSTIGDAKPGDLQGVRVYAYHIGNNQILLAYEIIESTLYLYSFGSHQNFYRELSKYLHK